MQNHTTRPAQLELQFAPLCKCGCGQPLPPPRYPSDNHKYITGHYPRERPLAERFWAKVTKGDEDDCWPWTGKVNGSGYGSLTAHGIGSGSHRISWFLRYGPIPEGLEVAHKCDNRICCNPHHLYLATHAENMTDMSRKGRGRRTPTVKGEEVPSAKLTAKQVMQIRQDHQTGISMRQIAREYGLAHKTVSQIVKRTAWKHIP